MRPTLLSLTAAFAIGCHSDGSQNPNIGCGGAEYPDWETSSYVLPYPVGVEHKVNLSHCSGSYHSLDLPDAFATDFAMPVGTYITAARDGEVVRVVEDGFDFSNPNNLVIVDHGDGTFAQYMHLTHDGALVEQGESVEQGDTLALSGATGLAGYPHLHFVVTDGGWQWPYTSIPVNFSNTDPNPLGPVENTEYEAFPY